jgi:hypothetical protein
MLRMADGAPVPSNQRPFLITVSYCIVSLLLLSQ